LWGRRIQESTESVLERAVSRERLLPFSEDLRPHSLQTSDLERTLSCARSVWMTLLYDATLGCTSSGGWWNIAIISCGCPVAVHACAHQKTHRVRFVR
jgi:hypothetical protein